MSKTFYSNGKLLLTAEYLVLDGALALAVPTKFGQWLTIEPINENKIVWESLDENNEVWFRKTYNIPETAFPFAYDYSINLDKGNRFTNEEKTLLKILFNANRINHDFLYKYTLTTDQGVKVTSKLDFSKNWGLGTSSTLINNIAQWANVDPYELLARTFGGSGYDIACAIHNVPLTYQLEKNERTIIERDFNPEFKEHLYFVFLNKKQNSRDGIATYQKNKSNTNHALSEINAITNDILHCTSLENFQFLMQNHETIISKIIKQQPIQELIFNDFNGSIKSLGAWGGDFVLVASEDNPVSYFKAKGFDTIIPYDDMVL